LVGLRPFWICLRVGLHLSYQASVFFRFLFRLPFQQSFLLLFPLDFDCSFSVGLYTFQIGLCRDFQSSYGSYQRFEILHNILYPGLKPDGAQFTVQSNRLIKSKLI
jgi:hypothetical protein